MNASSSAALLLLGLVACDGPEVVPPDRTPPPAPCRQAVIAGAPIVALAWTELRETYLPPGMASDSVAIDYLVSPAAHVDRVVVTFDFDPVLALSPFDATGECLSSIPTPALVAVVPEGTEDIVRATVVASSEAGYARTGRLFVSTGSTSLEVRTEGLDPGDPSNGGWWALFEPAAGNSRLLVLPAQLDRTTLLVEGIPANQPGTLALIQTTALQQDPATGAIYAPWGFSSDWPRYAHGWYGLTVTQAEGSLATLTPILPPTDDFARAHGNDPALGEGADSAYRRLTTDELTTIAVACEASSVTVRVLTFSEVSLEGSPRVYNAGETATVSGACEPGASSWVLSLSARSLNGRNGAVMLHRAGEVLP